MAKVPFLIVGGGLAGAKAAESLRDEGVTDEITLIAAEPDRPYHRPPLSKDYMRGESKREDVFVHPATWAERNRVTLELGTKADKLDVGARTVSVGSKMFEFERLLIATGSEPIPLPVPGGQLAGVYLLRTLRDSETIQKAAKGKKSAVLIGGGFIATELAASLHQMGLETFLITREKIVWEKFFGPALSAVFQRTMVDGGAHVLNEDEVIRIEGDTNVKQVVTKKGQTIPCDLVVAGVGVKPILDLAKSGGLEVEDGVIVNRFLQTSAPGIYAAGDIATFYSPLYSKSMRVEHWDVAQQHGILAGKNMAREAARKSDEREPFDQPPYFFSDLFDLSMEYLGDNKEADEHITRGDPTGKEFTGFYLKKGRLVAALFANRNPDVEPTKALIRQRLQVDLLMRSRLADPAFDLAKLGSG